MAITVAISVGLALLLLTLLAVTVGVRNSHKRDSRANGGPATVFVASLAYIIVIAPVFTPDGITGASVLLFIALAALPAILGGLMVRVRASLGPAARSLYDTVGIITAFALLTGVLATTGELVSLIGGLNRYLVVLVIGLAGAGYLLARGREAASRTSRWTIAFAFFLPVILLLFGGAVGSLSTITNSLVPSTPIPVGTAGALIAAVIALSIFDPSIGAVLRGSQRPGRAALVGAAIAAGFVLVFGLALILIYGGAFVAPSLQAFLIAAAPPVVIGYFMFMATFVLSSTADTQLASGSEVASEAIDPMKRRPITFIMVIVAIVIAMFAPAPGQIFIAAALVAAAAFGALLPAITGSVPNLKPLPATIVGLVAAAIVAGVISIEATFSFRAATLIALCVAFLLSGAVSFVMARRGHEVAAAS